MNEKTKPAPAEAADPKTKLFAVTQAFWLGDKLCAEGSQVQLTESQAKRLGDAAKPV